MNTIRSNFLFFILLLNLSHSYAAFPVKTSERIQLQDTASATGFVHKTNPRMMRTMKRTYRTYRSTNSWSGRTLPIVSSSFAIAALIMVIIAATGGGAIALFLGMFAILFIITAFVTGLIALIYKCPLKGLAIFGMSLLMAMVLALVVAAI